MNDKKTVTVTQAASASVPADYVKISVVAAATEPSYKAATDGADALSKSAMARLSAVDKGKAIKLHANSASVAAQHDKNDYVKITGYRAQAAFSAEFDLDCALLGRVLEVLGDSGCEWRLSYSLKTNDKSEELIADAVKAARRRAEVIACAAGAKLGSLVKAEYCSGGVAPVMYAARSNGMADAEPESITLSETVVCTFEIA